MEAVKVVDEELRTLFEEADRLQTKELHRRIISYLPDKSLSIIKNKNGKAKSPERGKQNKIGS